MWRDWTDGWCGGGEVQVVIIPSINTLSLAYDGRTCMDVPANACALKVQIQGISNGRQGVVISWREEWYFEIIRK